MYEFKTQWCPVGGPHDWESCVYAHTYRDWRRTARIGYTSHPCQHWARSVTSGGRRELNYGQRCPRGVSCPFAHGAKEQLYHPQFYKTSPCSEANCRRGPLCAFTHEGRDTRNLPAEFLAAAALPTGAAPLADAELLLKQHQPTYWMPPRYHALEEQAGDKGGGSVTSSAASKGRSRRRRGSGDASAQATQPDLSTPMQIPMQIPDAIYPSWPIVQSGCSAPVWGNEMAWPAAWPVHPAMVPVQTYQMVMPTTHLTASAPFHVDGISTEAGLQGACPLSWTPTVPAYTASVPRPATMPEFFDLESSFSAAKLASILQAAQAGIIGGGKSPKRRSRHSGLRTPSSFGGTPMSMTPTESRTPTEVPSTPVDSDNEMAIEECSGPPSHEGSTKASAASSLVGAYGGCASDAESLPSASS